MAYSENEINQIRETLDKMKVEGWNRISTSLSLIETKTITAENFIYMAQKTKTEIEDYLKSKGI